MPSLTSTPFAAYSASKAMHPRLAEFWGASRVMTGVRKRTEVIVITSAREWFLYILTMLKPIRSHMNLGKCTCCGSTASFYDGDIGAYYCSACAFLAAEKLIEIATRVYLAIANPASYQLQ